MPAAGSPVNTALSNRMVSSATLKSARLSTLPFPSAVSNTKLSWPPSPRSMSALRPPLIVLFCALPVMSLAKLLPVPFIAALPIRVRSSTLAVRV